MLARTLISECPAQKHVVGCFFFRGRGNKGGCQLRVKAANTEINLVNHRNVVFEVLMFIIFFHRHLHQGSY